MVVAMSTLHAMYLTKCVNGFKYFRVVVYVISLVYGCSGCCACHIFVKMYE